MKWMFLVVAMMAAAPSWSQDRGPGYDRGGLYEGLFADHSLTPSAGSVRLNPRMGATTPQDSSSQLPVTTPTDRAAEAPPMKSLKDLAKDRRSAE